MSYQAPAQDGGPVFRYRPPTVTVITMEARLSSGHTPARSGQQSWRNFAASPRDCRKLFATRTTGDPPARPATGPGRAIASPQGLLYSGGSIFGPNWVNFVSKIRATLRFPPTGNRPLA